jgi:hypothetical protein
MIIEPGIAAPKLLAFGTPERIADHRGIAATVIQIDGIWIMTGLPVALPQQL